MTEDSKLTRLTGNLLVAVRDQVDHLIQRGDVDREQLKVIIGPAARKEIAKSGKAEGKSERQIAKELGVSHTTIQRDLAGTDVPSLPLEDGTEVPLSLSLEAPTARGESDILEQAKKIRAKKADAQRAERIEQIAEISKGNALLDTSTRYPIIYADPPWQYENPPMGGGNRSIENHYPTMILEEICALPVRDLAAPDALLYLWATAPKLSECMRVIEAWGFEYRTNFVWVKDKIGMGYHARSQHELLLVARKGNIPPPAVSDRKSSVVEAPRSEHSKKPEVFYELIESFYPQLPKIELFCRSSRKGWAAWGNQCS